MKQKWNCKLMEAKLENVISWVKKVSKLWKTKKQASSTRNKANRQQRDLWKTWLPVNPIANLKVKVMKQFAAESKIEKLVTKEVKRMWDRKQAKSHQAQEEAWARMAIAEGNHQDRTHEVALGRSVLISHLQIESEPKIKESSPRIVDEKHK